jgi:hypothetical protein
VRETLEIIGLLFRGTNIFQLGLGIILIILSLKDIGVSNLGWILELARKGKKKKKDDIISSVQNFMISHPRLNSFKNNHPGESWIKVKEKFHSAFVMCRLHLILHFNNH